MLASGHDMQSVDLYFPFPDATAQTVTERPSSVTATAFGARILRVDWTHSGNFPAFSTGRSFVITVIADRKSAQIKINDETARNHVLGGLTPYDYNTTIGIQYTVSVLANSSLSFPSDPVTTSVLSPRKPIIIANRQMGPGS